MYTTSIVGLAAHVADTDAVTAFIRVDPTQFFSRGTTVNATGGSETVYRSLVSDVSAPIDIRIGQYPATGKGANNTSIKITGLTETLDADGTVVSQDAFSCVLAMSFGGPSTGPSATERGQLVQLLSSLVLTLGDAGAFSYEGMDLLARGATGQIIA